MIDSLIEEKEKQLADNSYIEFTDDELNKLSLSDINRLKKTFHGRAIMRLPESEINFFKWLKENDNAVWNDLWDNEENLYQISIDFLQRFTKDGNGFPICDLLKEDNYWFCSKHIKPGGLEKIDLISDKIKRDKILSFEEALLAEVMRNSIDIWHFCYRYQVPVNIAKEKVNEMDINNILVHLKSSDDLIKYLDI